MRDDIQQDHLSTWVEQNVALSSLLALQLGIRGDLIRFDVTDHLAADESSAVRHASGTRWESTLSPKLNLMLSASARTRLFVNLGTGFHSNDARDAILATDARVLPRAVGGEVGFRVADRSFAMTGALWRLDLQSELVYVGDEGVTEPSGRSRRAGIDFDGRMRLLRWLWADTDVTLSRGRFVDEPVNADRVPLAPTFTSAGGLSVRDLPLNGGIRYRHIGARAADETGDVIAPGSTVWEAFTSYRFRSASIALSINNLFNAVWNEAQFSTTSRLRGERTEVTELHFTPGAPRGVIISVEYRL